MRLLLVVEEVKLGGAELSFLELARALSPHCNLHLALSERSVKAQSATALFKSLQGSVVLHVCHSALNSGTYSLLHRRLRRKSARELAQLIDAIDPDAVLVNLPTVERGQAVIDAADLCRRRPPVWGFLHLSHPPSRIGARAGRFRDNLVPALLRRFDRLLTVSHAGARQLRESYGIAAVEVVHPPTGILRPISVPLERERRRAEAGLPDGFLLGMVGRVQVYHKGQDVALRLIARLIKEGSRLHLAVLGDGPDLAPMRQLTEELAIAPHVSFLGWRNDAGRLIPLFDAIILPSRFEGLPQTAMQAATAHVPVVGYAVDGLAELLPAPFQVPYGDEEGLAAVIRRLINGDLAWPAGEMAMRAAEWGNPEKAAERVLELLGWVPAPGSDGASGSSQQDGAGAQEVLPRQP